MITTTTITNDRKNRLETQGQAVSGTQYKIEWRKEESKGRRAEPYVSFIGAVRAAEAMQETAKDNGIGMTFSVIDSQNQTVFIC